MVFYGLSSWMKLLAILLKLISESNGLTSSAAMYPCGWERHKDNCAGSEVIRMDHIDVTLQKAKTEKWIPVFPTFSEITFIFIHFRLNGLIFIALACFGVTLLLCQDGVQWHYP